MDRKAAFIGVWALITILTLIMSSVTGFMGTYAGSGFHEVKPASIDFTYVATLPLSLGTWLFSYGLSVCIWRKKSQLPFVILVPAFLSFWVNFLFMKGQQPA